MAAEATPQHTGKGIIILGGVGGGITGLVAGGIGGIVCLWLVFIWSWKCRESELLRRRLS